MIMEQTPELWVLRSEVQYSMPVSRNPDCIAENSRGLVYIRAKPASRVYHFRGAKSLVGIIGTSRINREPIAILSFVLLPWERVRR